MFVANRAGKNIINVWSIIIFVYLSLSGWYFSSIASANFPEMPVYEAFNGLILYMLFAGMLMRVYIPFNPVADILHYGHLPVNRNLLLKWSVGWSFMSKGFLFLIIFVGSYIISNMSRYFSGAECARFFIAFTLLLIVRQFLYMCLRLLFRDPSRTVQCVLWGLFAVVIIAVFFIPVTQISRTLGMYMITGNILLWLTLVGFILAGYYCYLTILSKHLYRELERSGGISGLVSKSFSIKQGLGTTAIMIWLEYVRLIRHKKGWVTFIIPIAMLFMIIFFFNKGESGEFYIIAYFVITGISTPGQAGRQYIYSIESFHFDGLMVKKGIVRSLLFVRYYSDIFITFIVALPFLTLVFMGRITIADLLACFIFSIGFNNLIMYYMASVNRARMDMIGSSQSHGINGVQWVIMVLFMIFIGILAILLIIFSPFSWKTLPLMLIGLFGFAFHRVWLSWIYRRFYKRRYRAMEGFRGG